MAKRANGEGSIIYIDSKKLWASTIYLGKDKEGTPQKIRKYSKTQKEAKKVLHDLVVKYNTLKLEKDLTLNSWFPTWVFEFIEVNEKTKQNYISIFNNHIAPYKIAKMKLSDITSFDIKKYFNELAKDGRSKQRITTIKNRLNAMFNDSLEYITRNPMAGVKVPNSARTASRSYKNSDIEKEDKDINAFTVEEQKQLLDFLKMDPLNVFNLLFITFLATGLRLGEALALKWSDISADYSQIDINKNLQRVPVFKDRKVDHYELKEMPPKSEAGYRVMPLPSTLAALLKKAHLNHKLRARMDPYYEDNNIVFSNDLGAHIEAKAPLRRLRKIEKELKISPVNIHGLRHSYATRLFEKGEEIEIVSSLLGHSSVDITRDVYVHILNERKKKVAQRIEEILTL